MCRTSDEVNPVVIGRLGRCKGKPTVCVYGHYDIQPAMEREWQTDPFELTAIDGYYYGRGTSDNKVYRKSFPLLERSPSTWKTDELDIAVELSNADSP